MKKILLAATAALALACTAQAITFDVVVSGSLTELTRPSDNPLGLNASPLLDAWSWEYQVDATSEPLTILDVIAATVNGIPGTFTVYDVLGPWATASLDTINPFATQFTAQTANGPLQNWNWIAEIKATEIAFRIQESGFDSYVYSGSTVLESVSAAAVPDSSSTAALASLGLVAIVVISRRRSRR